MLKMQVKLLHWYKKFSISKISEVCLLEKIKDRMKWYQPHLLAEAYGRAGRFDEAVELLEHVVADHWKGGTPWDWFLLAMAHHQLGNAEDAQKWLDQGVQWMDEGPEEYKLPKSRGLAVQYLDFLDPELKKKIVNEDYSKTRIGVAGSESWRAGKGPVSGRLGHRCAIPARRGPVEGSSPSTRDPFFTPPGGREPVEGVHYLWYPLFF